jgi:hypothetical protein
MWMTLLLSAAPTFVQPPSAPHLSQEDEDDLMSLVPS